ncbi:hypothetical protein [Rickettsia sp. MEAM1 (Bemisia tabaci)]|nr:hypothetical protein [Rickettsia sp. MEAM1 (Bemisia tabaci)]
MLLLFYKSFPVIAQYLIYTSLNLTVPKNVIKKCCFLLNSALTYIFMSTF